MPSSDHQDDPGVLITWTRVGNGEVLVVATCKRCSVLREHLVEDAPDVGGLAMLVGTEALTEAGCTHAETVTSTRRRE